MSFATRGGFVDHQRYPARRRVGSLSIHFAEPLLIDARWRVLPENKPRSV